MENFEAFLKTNNFFTHPEFLKSIQLIITLHASTVHMNQKVKRVYQVAEKPQKFNSPAGQHILEFLNQTTKTSRGAKQARGVLTGGHAQSCTMKFFSLYISSKS